MYMRLQIRCVLFYAAVLALLVFAVQVCAEEKMMSISEKDFQFYIQTIDKQKKQIKIIEEEVIVDLKKSISKLQIKIENYKDMEGISDKIMEGLEKSKDILEEQAEYYEKRVVSYREEVLRLETKGVKDRIGKVSRVVENTATGCLSGLAFAGIGLPVGCAMGFISGLVKDFIHGF